MEIPLRRPSSFSPLPQAKLDKYRRKSNDEKIQLWVNLSAKLYEVVFGRGRVSSDFPNSAAYIFKTQAW